MWISPAFIEKPDLAVIAENGTLTFMTTKDQLIQVFNTNGASVSRFSMKAGDIHTIELPAGVYIVNGEKDYHKIRRTAI